MKAKLLNGEIVELKKDCDCTHHDGPHWLHMDRVWSNMLSDDLDNLQEQLKNVTTYSQGDFLQAKIQAICAEQLERLDEKLRWFKFYGIEELLSEQPTTA